MKILLVDDDVALSQLVSRRLRKDNYVVEFAPDGEHALSLITASSYSLVLLDLMLPKLSGLEVCQQIRSQGVRTPILMLTGQSNTSQKVSGLDAGADDYLVKPFKLEELAARTRALIRRGSDVASVVISQGPLQFDPEAQILTYKGKPVSLRPKEMAILEIMMRYPSRVFNADSILDWLWDSADCPGKATIKAHIRSIRQRLAAAGANSVIETVYGRGYRLSQALLERELTCTVEDNLSKDCSHQNIIAETWAQVQTVSWHRVSQLKALSQRAVRSRRSPVTEKTSTEVTNNELTAYASWQDNRTAAIAIAHQLKGTLGSFGFPMASLQAKHIEELLMLNDESSLPRDIEISLLQNQVSVLEKLLKQHMTVDETVLKTPPKTPYVLAVCHDEDWAQSLHSSNHNSALKIKTCGPLEIDGYLLEQTPAVILIEISTTDWAIDVSLLCTLADNYSRQVPMIAVPDAELPKAQLADISRKVSKIALKSWPIESILTTTAEYI